MKKLIILTPLQEKPKIYKTAKFNIGQPVSVIKWTPKKPIIIDGHVLFIGIENLFQNEFVYLIAALSMIISNKINMLMRIFPNCPLDYIIENLNNGIMRALFVKELKEEHPECFDKDKIFN